jgi:hypothetical protein
MKKIALFFALILGVVNTSLAANYPDMNKWEVLHLANGTVGKGCVCIILKDGKLLGLKYNQVLVNDWKNIQQNSNVVFKVSNDKLGYYDLYINNNKVRSGIEIITYSSNQVKNMSHHTKGTFDSNGNCGANLRQTITNNLLFN